MAISVNPLTHVIYVPKADLTLAQASPEVRTLDVNEFRLWLKDWEDEVEGIVQPKTHNHNTAVSLAGLTYARIVEILDPYTVEFEDGQYTINCVGANHNISDVKVANQVSLIVNNAAGLITMEAIEYSSFSGGVTVDTTLTTTQTMYPWGTPQAPVGNFTDSLLIADNRGFNTLFVIGDALLDNSNDFDGMMVIGESMNQSVITVSSDASVQSCEFYDCSLTGTLDGEALAKNCIIGDINYINGTIEQCILETGTILLGGGAEAHFLDCWSGACSGGIPKIDLGGSGQELSVRNYNGGVELINKSGSDIVSVDLGSGVVMMSNTVTAGTVVVRGVGILTDMDGNHIYTGTWNGVSVTNELLTPRLDDLHKLQGLDANNPLTTTQTTRVAGDISQTITGDGVTTSTVTRN